MNNFNTKLENFLSSNGIVIHIFNHYGWYTETFTREEKVFRIFPYYTNSPKGSISFSLDIAKVFKPLFVSKLILNHVGKRLNENLFRENLGSIFLNEEGKKISVFTFDQLMEQTFYHKNLKRKVFYRQLLRLGLYKLIKHFLEEQNYQPVEV